MTTVSIQSGNVRDISWLAASMRQSDREEIAATKPEHLSMVEYCALFPTNLSWTSWIDDQPVGAYGFSQGWPRHVWSAWAFGTDRFSRSVPQISRHIRLEVIPTLVSMGVRRVEARSIFSHERAHAWMESLGAVKEAEMEAYGNQGETFYLFAWTRERLDKPSNMLSESAPITQHVVDDTPDVSETDEIASDSHARIGG